jgi:hypothetical protein
MSSNGNNNGEIVRSDSNGAVERTLLLDEEAQPNILLALPLYRTVPAKFVCHLLSMDQQMIAGYVYSEGAYLTLSMELICQRALEFPGHWDRLVVIEHDMVPDKAALNRMANYLPERHIVGSMYFQHTPPFYAVALGPKEIGSEELVPFGPDVVKQVVEEPALYECSAVGMGFTCIQREVLENWDYDKVGPMWRTHPDSHDIRFCRLAREQGWGVYVDSAILCEHLTESTVAYAHNQAMTQLDEQIRVADLVPSTGNSGPTI